jgi:hypothetical protein
MHKPTRKVMSMVPNHHYLDGYNDCVEESTAYTAALEDMVRRLIDAGTPKVDTPEEVVLRCKAYEVLGDLHASFGESMKMAGVVRKCEQDRATAYDVDMDQEKDAQGETS